MQLILRGRRAVRLSPGVIKNMSGPGERGSEEAGKRDEGMLWSSVLNSYILQERRQFN